MGSVKLRLMMYSMSGSVRYVLAGYFGSEGTCPTPGLSCCRKRERGTSGRWRQSGYSRRGNHFPRRCFRPVREGFPSHGSSGIRPLSWAPCRAGDLHVGASPSWVIHTSLHGGLTAFAALLVPITSLSASPRQPIRKRSSRPWLLGASRPPAVSG